ncbi:MAG: PucR family transcriptional regulator ligand-binding domain-containing protein [Candidatus Bipolaricaulota bacterium]
MALTVREAMTIAEPLRRAKVVAGEQGLDNVIQSVNVMEVPNILDWVHPGELLVTTLYPLRDDAAAVETLVPRLAERGLAGLAVTSDSFIKELPACMLDAANELGFPLIELPPRVSFIDIIQPLTSRILNLQADELRQSEAILRQFVDLVLSGGSYSDIAHVIAQVVGQPVTIVDRFRRVLGSGVLAGGRAIEHGGFLEEDTTGDLYLSENYAPVTVEALPGGSARRLEVPTGMGPLLHLSRSVRVSSLDLGEIIVWGELPYPLHSAEMVALEHGATVTALKMMEMRSLNQVEQQFQNEILEGLLSDRPGARDNARHLAAGMGAQLEPPFFVVVVAPDLPSGTLLSSAERLQQSRIDSSLHLARRYVRIAHPDASFWRHGSRLVVFLPQGRARTPGDGGTLTEELGQICARIEQQNAPHTVSLGISGLTRDLAEFRHAYQCAVQSIEIGKALHKRATSVVARYEDLGLFRFISRTDSPEGLKRFCEDVLGPLLERDRTAGSQLVETLRVYLAENRNLGKAARALGIHYNTMRYRVGRVREILGTSLDDPSRRLAIEVALQLHPLVSRPNGE